MPLKLSPLKISPLSKKKNGLTGLDPILWLESGISHYNLDTGRVSTWVKTNGTDATQTTAAFRPITLSDSGDDVIDFDDTARYLVSTTFSEFVNSDNNNGGFEVWSAIKLDDGRQAGTPIYFGARTSSKLFFQFWSDSAGKIRWYLGDTVGSDARAKSLSPVLPSGQTGWLIFRLVHNEAENQMEIWLNGIKLELDLSDDGDTTGLNFSNYNPTRPIYFNGRNNNNNSHDFATDGMLMGDFIAFNKLLTTSQANSVLNYLI